MLVCFLVALPKGGWLLSSWGLGRAGLLGGNRQEFRMPRASVAVRRRISRREQAKLLVVGGWVEVRERLVAFLMPRTF